MSFTLFIPVLNEIDGLQVIMPQIPTELFNQILIVDGNSTDGTIEWCQKQGYDVYVQKKKGLHNAYMESWGLIKGEYVVTFSPDGNCRPQDLKLLVSELISSKADMVIASRYKEGAGSEDDDLLTAFGNKLFTTLANVLYGARYTDALGIYRGYRSKLFYDLKLNDPLSYREESFMGTMAGVEYLLSIRAAKKKLKIEEIPSPEPKRIYGVRKLQAFRWGLIFLIHAFRELRFK